MLPAFFPYGGKNRQLNLEVLPDMWTIYKMYANRAGFDLGAAQEQRRFCKAYFNLFFSLPTTT